MQQTLVTAWRELPGLREAERFDAWIHRILVHACYAEAKRAAQWSASVAVLPIDGPSTPDTTLSVATRDALERAFPLGGIMDMGPGDSVRVWILDVDGERLVIDSSAAPTPVRGCPGTGPGGPGLDQHRPRQLTRSISS